jgi:hypothetical protein
MGNALWGREALADGRDGAGARLLTGCADRRSVAIKELKRERALSLGYRGASIHELPRRLILGNSYTRSSIASLRLRAIGGWTGGERKEAGTPEETPALPRLVKPWTRFDTVPLCQATLSIGLYLLLEVQFQHLYCSPYVSGFKPDCLYSRAAEKGYLLGNSYPKTA